jgi:hypothetical protein
MVRDTHLRTQLLSQFLTQKTAQVALQQVDNLKYFLISAPVDVRKYSLYFLFQKLAGC